MHRVASISDVRNVAEAAREEAFGLLIGAAFTAALFVGMAYFENIGSTEPAGEIEEVRMVAASFEPPPPPLPTVDRTPAPEAVLPLAGIEVASSDSPVTIAVVPPDLEEFIPTTTNPPRAAIQFGHLHTELKPKMDLEMDVRHVYQDTEVDQPPRAVVRVAPPIPRHVRGSATTLRVVLILLIDQKGKAQSSRVLQSSGNKEFDEIVARNVKEEWLFSPAIRQGKKVRCMAQQAFRVNFSSASPFEAH